MDDATWITTSDVEYTFVAIIGVQTLGRFYIRWKSSGLYWDDLFNGLATLCLLAYIAVPSQTDESSPAFWQIIMLSYMLAWTILWLVKASFLALCWSIFMVSPKFRRAWWLITIYTFWSFWPIFLALLWQCGSPSKYDDPATCQAFDPTTIAKAIWGLDLALHLSSELLILGLPLWFISKLQMSRAQRAGASSIFCAALVTIIMGFLRNLASLCATSDHIGTGSNILCGGDVGKWALIEDFALLFEPPLAVFVCALPPYKILIAKIFKKRKTSPELQQNAAQAEQAAFPGKKAKPAAQPMDSIAELERECVV